MGSGRKLYLIVTGPAGSGKTTLVRSLGEWIEENQGLGVCYVNLDPGVETLPYRPDVDVREYVRIRDIMEREGLGPNGAFLVGMERIMGMVGDILGPAEKSSADVVMVDTPGQMEIFVFQEAGPHIASYIAARGPTCGLMVIDATLARKAPELAALKMLVLAAQLRLSIPLVTVINKCDLSEAGEAAKFLQNPSEYYEELGRSKGLLSEVALEVSRVLDRYSVATRIPLISALRRQGMETIYDMVHEVWCACGDLT